MTPQTKHQKINNAISEIRDMKSQVDVKYQEESILRERMNNFLAQYQSYLGELDKQVEEFSGKIANTRLQIENLNRLSEPPPDKEQNIHDDLPDTQTESIELLESVDTDIPRDDENEFSDFSMDEAPTPSELDEKAKKDEILKHFARFWHPDHSTSSATPINGFMTVLNTAFNEATDSADLLAAIPWDAAWEQRKSNESIGDQWERLTDWHTSLEIASERLDQKLASVKNDWRYPLFSDWNKETEKQTFFTDIANNKRDEVKSLESTLQALSEEIQNLSQDSHDIGQESPNSGSKTPW